MRTSFRRDRKARVRRATFPSSNEIHVTLYLVAIALCIFSTGLTTRREFPGMRCGLHALPRDPVSGVPFELGFPTRHAIQSRGARGADVDSLLVAPCLWLASRKASPARGQDCALPRAHGMAIGAGALFTWPLMLSAHLGTRSPILWNRPAGSTRGPSTPRC